MKLAGGKRKNYCKKYVKLDTNVGYLGGQDVHG